MRQYSDRKRSELTPVGPAFFSPILPSPKRRYIQYFHGALYPPWDKYVHRIVAKVHERGRLTDEETAQWAVTPLAFDRSEATFTGKQCLEGCKSRAEHPKAEGPPCVHDE